MYHVQPAVKKSEVGVESYSLADYQAYLAREAEQKFQDEHSEVFNGTSQMEGSTTGDGSEPQAPPGFKLHKIEHGDNLVSLSLRYNVSQARLRKFNRDACFGKRLAHMTGRYLLIPESAASALTNEVEDILQNLNDASEPTAPQELTDEGKYNLKKAFNYHVKGQVDAFRIDYYMGEANWNLREAIRLFETDNKFEKKHILCKKFNLKAHEAEELLKMNGWDLVLAERYWHAHNAAPPSQNPSTSRGGTQEMSMLKRRLVDGEQKTDDANVVYPNQIPPNYGVLSSCCGNDSLRMHTEQAIAQ